MESSHSTAKPFGSSHSNIPRPSLAKTRPRVSSAVQAARNLKRRSIEHLSKPLPSEIPAKRVVFNAGSHSVTKPLPPSMRTGRATLASSSALSRCHQPIASGLSRQSASSTRPSRNIATDSNAARVSTVRRSPSFTREASTLSELRSKLEGEISKLSAENELLKSQLSLKDQNIVTLQNSVECYREAVSMKDAQLSTLQLLVDTEKLKNSTLQSKVEQLERGYNEQQKCCQRLLLELSAKKDELRAKDEEVRLLHNDVVDLKGQIRVAVRVRPALGKELDVPIMHISYPGMTSIKLDQGKTAQTFEFQNVFGPNMTQARLFGEVQELILSCLHGYNVSIIAYGQTGSGKTYTMRGGTGDLEGVIPRAVKFLFTSKDKLSDLDWKFDFNASFLEVYNEEVYDLLAERKKLEVKIGSGSTVVTGLTFREISDPDDIEKVLVLADRTRSTAATKCNQQSSRSHAVFELAIRGINETSGAVRHASLHLVDLAGSERVKESGAEGERFKEMTFINSALSNLQNCIRSQLGKNQHIPYRNSKLTMLLKDSLGAGNSKTMVVVALNPVITQIAETKRSLEFAQQMSLTKIGFARKQEQ